MSTRYAAAALLIASLAAVMLPGCATQTGRSEAFAHTGALGTDLRRGVSSKADVLLLLGEPDGTGALGGFDALRGPEHARLGPEDAWYYESVGASLTNADQNILVVFFLGDIFDGYLWFSNSAELRIR